MLCWRKRLLRVQERYGTTVIHEDDAEEEGDEEAYGTVVVAGEPAAAGGYLDAVRMAGEHYASREPSPMARSAGGAGGAAGSSPQSGYWAAVASASEGGAQPLNFFALVWPCAWCDWVGRVIACALSSVSERRIRPLVGGRPATLQVMLCPGCELRNG